ncbi:hypothetical protein GGF41_000314 [Coemansia sp. RSA 2531]|nr:hypothetical protein GGF41_000314 [Coemansia sp. RSA 2531]
MLLARVKPDLELGGITNLVHIKCVIDKPELSFIKLACQNATTLESLVIISCGGIDVTSIIQDQVGELVTGNVATLESLHLYLGRMAIDVLRVYGVFTAVSHPKLCSVKLWYEMACVTKMFATNAEAMQFAMEIGRTALIRDIGGYPNCDELMPSLFQLNGLDYIQVLSLDTPYLDLWEVVALIWVLPMMSDLYLMAFSLGPLLDGVTLDELPAFVISTYTPIGKRFRYWHFKDSIMGVLNVEVKCVLLLALACPNFTFVSTPPTMRKEFIKQLKAEIDTDMFKPYASRFQCFIS